MYKGTEVAINQPLGLEFIPFSESKVQRPSAFETTLDNEPQTAKDMEGNLKTRQYIKTTHINEE